MIIPDEVICKTCERVFCCSQCRKKHEVKTHAKVACCVEPIVHLFCPICQNKPFMLHAEIQSDLFVHITENHLPLNCKKCYRLYTKVEDLLDFSKCIQSNAHCKLEVQEISSSLIEKEPSPPPLKRLASSVSTQTSPMLVPEINNSRLTPISMINLRWKAKSKAAEEFISDSASSIKNISSINNSSLRKSIGIGIPTTKGKLVRSTSTPLQAEVFAKAKEQAFNVSGAHVSSIYNSASDPETSPPLVLPSGTPSKRPVEAVNRYQKPRCRGKMSVAVTPLRQVMSKSIQKAIAEHRIAAETRDAGFNRKKMFDSVDTSYDILEKSAENYALDLRLSPALRRTQSEIIDRKSHIEFLSTLPPRTVHREILLSSTKKTTESIVITSTSSSTAESVTGKMQKGNQSGNSFYQTCQSVEIITSTSTELSDVLLETNVPQSSSGIPPITPRIPNSGVIINKKLIKFETPVVLHKNKIEKHSPDEKYFTPSSTPVRASRVGKGIQYQNSSDNSLPRTFYSMEEQENDKTKSFNSNHSDIAFDDEVFIEDIKPKKGKSRLWTFVASVIGLPSIHGGENRSKCNDKTALSSNSTSLIKRCASFAGSLVRHKTIADEKGQAFKRKRSYAADALSSDFDNINYTDFDLTCSESKRLRIQGRKPIQRMQRNY